MRAKKRKKAADKPHHRYYENNPNVPKLSWVDLLGRTAVSSNDHNLGKVEAVNAEFTVIKKGFAKVDRYYIPTKMLADIATDKKLKFNLTKDQLGTYKKDQVPNPSNFATLGGSSHMAYPPIPYMPDKMLKKKYRTESESEKEKE